jgi:hypothetical protein
MVAILATTGRFNFKTTARAVIPLTVNEAYGMASTPGSNCDNGYFSPGDTNVNSLLSIL